MRTSDKGLIAIARHEGLIPAPYLDVAGVWTFGIGHAETAGTPPNPSQMPRGMPADIDAAIRQSFALFRARIGLYEDAVNRAVTVPLRPHEYDALVSLCYNIGAGGFQRSSVVRHMKNGHRERAADAFLAWNKARVDGELRAVPGLTARRKEERIMFLESQYGRLSVPVWGVTASNKPNMARALRIINETEALAYLGALPEAPSSATTPAQPQPEPQSKGGLVAAFLRILARIFGGKA
jgi:lysozyme